MYMCVCACMYMYVYIFFVFRVDINQHHEVRSTSNFWCQRIIMIALKCDIVLSESKIGSSYYSSWKASLISKSQKCRLNCQP